MTEFEKDILSGLSAKKKYIHSKYFYDERGDELFRKIMNMPEYYPTDAEHEIFSKHCDKLISFLKSSNRGFNLIELGPGDGYKTKVLLEHLYKNGTDFKYIPIDISDNVITLLTKNLKNEFPGLEIESRAEDYFVALDDIHKHTDRQLVVFFLGSNIGNLSEEESGAFLNEVSSKLNPGDKLLIGLDLKKDPHKIALAYNDPQGITRDFNLNLLERLNRELGANFDLSKFIHYPTYDPENGTAKSFLVSKEDQIVYIEKLEKSFFFEAWELIHTEISQKYDVEMIDLMAMQSGFKVERNFYDSRRYFVDSLWVKV